MSREQNQRTEIHVIAMDWRRLRYLRTWLGETLRTDVEIAKRERYLARKNARKMRQREAVSA